MTDAAIIAAMRSEMPDDAELKESLQRFGWVEELPAIQDEHGLTIVGNRRLRLAAELGIDPVIKHIKVGSGEAADAKRFRLVIASNIGTRPMTKAERQNLAIYLYQTRGWVLKRIADALGVGFTTAQRYLEGLSTPDKPPRPNGGRPKGSKKPRERKYAPTVEAKAAALNLDQGVAVTKVAKKLGVSEQVVIRSVERERGRREVLSEPTIAREDLSLTAQEKLDIAIRQHKKMLDASFEDRLRAECLKHDEIWLKQELELFDNARRIELSHKGVMSADDYKTIQRCLHTDVLDGIAKQGKIDANTRKRFDQALSIVNVLKLVLVREDRKAPPRPNMEEMMRRREEVFARRSAQSKASAAKRKQANGGATA